MRRDARNRPEKDKTFTSARNLLAVLRLSTALARLRLCNVVEKDDVKEAIRLVEMSKHSINNTKASENRSSQHILNQRRSKMYQIIRDLAGNGKIVKVPDIMERCTNKGFKPDEINDLIEEYEDLNVWQVNPARTRLTLN